MSNITVHVLQMLDGETNINSNSVFKTESDFEEAIKDAVTNWIDIQGLHALFSKNDGIKPEVGKVYLNLTVDVNNDFEKWTVTGYED